VFVLGGQLKKVYNERAERTTTTSFGPASQAGIFTVAVPEVAADGRFRGEGFALTLSQARGDSFALVQTAEGRGATRAQALSAAAKVRYAFQFADDTLLALEPGFTLVEGAPFALQEVTLRLQVPEGKPFRLSEDAAFIARDALRVIEEYDGYTNFSDRQLVFTRGKLRCLDCPPPVVDEPEEDTNADEDSDNVKASVQISDSSGTISGDVVDVSISKTGIETVVVDKSTGKKMRIHIEGDSLMKRATKKAHSQRKTH
jgi:hypothetical protein